MAARRPSTLPAEAADNSSVNWPLLHANLILVFLLAKAGERLAGDVWRNDLL